MTVYNVSVKLRDAYQRVSTRRFGVDATDHPTAVSDANLMLTDLAALTMAEIIEFTVGLKTAYSDSADSGANIDAGITLSMELSDGGKAPLRVPAPVAAALNADGTVDLTASVVTDFVDNWLSGDFLISDGETATALLSGKLDR
jgi:hypothetical protein